MKKLCELKDDEKVIVKYKEGMTEVIDWTIVNKVDTIYKEKVPSTAA